MRDKNGRLLPDISGNPGGRLREVATSASWRVTIPMRRSKRWSI
jgi:hypothetical protein